MNLKILSSSVKLTSPVGFRLLMWANLTSVSLSQSLLAINIFLVELMKDVVGLVLSPFASDAPQ